MNSLKIILLSSIFLFSNCSLINDKFFSKSERNKEKENETDEREIVKTSSKGSKEEDLIMERIYIDEDKNDEKSKNVEGLQGDSDYPNLADVPNRPDPVISMEEQKSIIKDLENNSQLESLPVEPVIESEISNIDPDFNKKKYRDIKSYKDTNNAIRDIQISKLAEIKNFKPDGSNLNNKASVSDEEKELHNIARQLKDIKTKEQINEVEDKIKKNDLYYTPQDIEKILGLKAQINKKEKDSSKEVEVKKTNIKKQDDVVKTRVIEKKIEERGIPVARVTFNHGSSQLSDNDISKIKEVASLFYKNEGKKIVIVGHSSSRTNYDMDLTKHALVNFNISLERARKVMQEFSTIGLNSQSIELIAMSDANPLYAEIMPRLEAANRRAEIFIHY
jgi:outer membrane protein OmpA-like peptidoglycan-associated protein